MVRRITRWLPPCFALACTWLWYHSYALDCDQGGQWGCEMSWMTPSYVPIDLPDSPVPRYNLHLYRENGWDQSKPVGHPVIFIPGNAGSYQQVRSIASSASRQYHGQPGGVAEDMHNAKQIDFYTLDLNEDFNAFLGDLIRDQATFLVHCVRLVQGLYDDPVQITLIGHSMGGIVARLAMTMGLDDAVDVLLTMSTPHLVPPATMDPQIEAIYREIRGSISPALLSVCGGVADTQIASDACALDLNPSEGFTIFTTGMPGVWTGVDHQAMVWCHQVRSKIARVLLEMTRDRSKSERIATASKWLLPGVRLTGSAEQPHRIHTIKGPTTFLTRQPPGSLELCEAGDCSPIEDYKLEQIPLLRPGRPFPIPGEGIQASDIGYALTMNVTGSVRLRCEGEDIAHGQSVTITSLTNEWIAPGPAVHYQVYFPDIRVSSLFAYRVEIEAVSCPDDVPLIKHSSLSNSNVYESRFFPADAPAILFHSHTGSAPFSSLHSRGLLVDIYQLAECGVRRVTIRREYWRSLAKAVSRYRMGVIAWTMGWSTAIAAVQQEGFDFTRGSVPGTPHQYIGATYTCLMILGVLQLALPDKLSSNLFLGTFEKEALFVYAFLAAWTLLFSLSVLLVFDSFASFTLRVWHRGERIKVSAPALASKSLFMAVLTFLVPHEILMSMLFVYQVYVYLTTGSSIARIGVLIMFHLLPFSLAPLAAWVRAIMTDWRNPPSMGHNVLIVIPAVGLALLSDQSTAEGDRLSRIAISGLRISSLLCFVVGPRHTYVLPWTNALTMMMICAATIRSRSGKTRQ